MDNFQFVGSIDPIPIILELQGQPELWNEHTGRREQYHSPHASVDDIWVRWSEGEEIDVGGARELKFLPAWYRLPSLRPLIFVLMAKVQAVELGAIFITRIPKGERVLPHVDKGWHANRFNRKVYVALQSNPDCINTAQDESITMKAGDCWVFRNTVVHEVINNGIDDRISAIVCMRWEG